MQTDFLDAHQRHLDDADILFNQENARLANADHLYGMAVECGLKHLMIAFGMAVDTTGGPVNKVDRVHADQLWMRYQSYLSGQPATYSLPTQNPFSDWSVNQRYAHHKCFDKAIVMPHKDAAHTIHNLVHQAQMQGLI